MKGDALASGAPALRFILDIVEEECASLKGIAKDRRKERGKKVKKGGPDGKPSAGPKAPSERMEELEV